MLKILDRVLTRFVPKVTASAGCSTTRSCHACPAPRQAFGRYKVTTCCQNEGCTSYWAACKTC